MRAALILFFLCAPSAWADAPCAEAEQGQLVPSEPLVFAAGTPMQVGSEAAIASLVCALERDPELTLHVEAHTDARGSGSYNLKLSQARADALRDALLAAGVAPERVAAVGYGETIPLASNDVAGGRSENRRIELHTEPFHTRPTPPAQPEPPAEPVPPEPVVDPWCVALAEAQKGGREVRWDRAVALASAAQRVQRCLGPEWTIHRDGEALYGTHADWLLRVEAAAEGATVWLEPDPSDSR